MALEAQDVSIRVRLLGGAQFKRDAAGVEDSLKGVGGAAEEARVGGGGAGGIGGFGTAVAAAGTHVDKASDKLVKHGEKLKQIGMNATVASVPIIYLGAKSVEAATKFQTAMSVLQRQANDSGRDVNFLTNQVLGMSTALGSNPNDLATGLYNVVSAGHHGKDAMNALKVAAQGAKIGVDDLQNTSTALMAVWNSGLGSRGRNGYANTMGVLDAIVGQGMMRLPDLTEALHSEIMPMVKETGGSLVDIGAIMSALTREGIPATKFANLSKLTLTKLMNPQGQALTALQSIDMSKYEMANDIRHHKHGLIYALSDLQQHLALVSPNERTSVLANAFGQSRGISNIMAILTQMPRIKRIAAVLDRKGNANYFDQHWKQYQGTYQYKMDQLKSATQSAEITLGRDILPTLIPLLTKIVHILQTMVGDFNKLPKPLRSFIVQMAAISVAIGPVLWIFGSLFKAVGGMMKLFGAEGIVAKIFGEGGLLAKVMPGLSTMFGGVAIEGEAMRGAFIAAIPEIAAFAGVIAGLAAMWHFRHQIGHAGYEAGQWIRHGLGIGPSHQQAEHSYLSGGAYKHLTPSQRSAMLMLLQQDQGSGHVRITKDLLGGSQVGVGGRALPFSYYEDALAGVQLPSWLHVPHLTNSSHRVLSDLGTSVKDGKLDMTMHNHIYIDGKLVARTVNKVNRQTNNRR